MPDDEKNQHQNDHRVSSAVKFVVDFGTSTFGVTISKTVIAPLDRVKLILQTRRGFTAKHGQLLPHQLRKKKTIAYTFKDIIARQGIQSLWRGNWSNIFRGVSAQPLMFSCHEFLLSLFSYKDMEDLPVMEVAHISMMSGGLAAAFTLSLTYQIYYCQSLISGFRGPLQKAKFSSLAGCFRAVYKKKGIRGLYAGFLVSQLTVILNRMLYFGLYDVFKAYILNNHTNISYGWSKITSAQAASLISSIVSHPIDTLAKRVILDSVMTKRRYSSAMRGMKIIIEEEGIQGLYSGGLVTIYRSLGGALVLLIHDELSHRLVKYLSFKNNKSI